MEWTLDLSVWPHSGVCDQIEGEVLVLTQSQVDMIERRRQERSMSIYEVVCEILSTWEDSTT
jgi:hypothetical protein